MIDHPDLAEGSAALHLAIKTMGQLAERRREYEATGYFPDDPNVSIDLFVLQMLIRMSDLYLKRRYEDAMGSL